MPSFPAVDDDPFAPPRPASPPSPPAVTPTITPSSEVDTSTSNEPPRPAAPPARPAPEEDDPFAPVKPRADRTPPPDAAPTATPARRDTHSDLARNADGQLPLRNWVDDTGQFRVQARLVQVLDGRVRLLKTTGRTTTVPLTRLSPADRTYVAEALARYGQQLLAPQLAARTAGQP
jgi:hypothetical protein